MFDELKKKLSGIIHNFTEKEESEEPQLQQPSTAPQEEHKPEVPQLQPKAPNPEEKPETPTPAGKQKGNEVNLSIPTKIKGVFLKSIKLSDSDIENFTEDLKVSMLQSDVSYKTTEEFISKLSQSMRESKYDSKNIGSQLKENVRAALLEVLKINNSGIDLFNYVLKRAEEGSIPVKILFLGPNGTGKTTTIAKIAYRLNKMSIPTVISASDTFRAAAIEQTEFHAKAVGAEVIKSGYGADPASVAFDAINYARSHGMPAVLIDTAGRQETNKNLLSEMQKIVRVVQPDITIFVGESTAGSIIAEQIKELSKAIKIDGIILTKIDCDAKGGSVISIADTTGIPVLLLGSGESYDALSKYSNDFIIDSLLNN